MYVWIMKIIGWNEWFFFLFFHWNVFKFVEKFAPYDKHAWNCLREFWSILQFQHLKHRIPVAQQMNMGTIHNEIIRYFTKRQYLWKTERPSVSLYCYISEYLTTIMLPQIMFFLHIHKLCIFPQFSMFTHKTMRFSQ